MPPEPRKRRSDLEESTDSGEEEGVEVELGVVEVVLSGAPKAALPGRVQDLLEAHVPSPRTHLLEACPFLFPWHWAVPTRSPPEPRSRSFHEESTDCGEEVEVEEV